jgi:hypothetical protein
MSTSTSSTQGENRADVSRDTFAPLDRFRRVFFQQGRPVLDADLNEQVASLLHYVACLAVDLGGAHFSAATPGFEIIKAVAEEKGIRTELSPGRYYVQGILCETNGATVLVPFGAVTPPLQPSHFYFFYLDVWERHVTHLVRPSLREVALAGGDTATRGQITWRLRFQEAPADPATSSYDTVLGWIETVPGTGLMQAKTDTAKADEGPCVLPPEARYRGPENQLYRIEVHALDRDAAGNVNALKLKWSRDNGSVLFAVRELQGDSLVVSAFGVDARFGLAPNDWVELVDEGGDPLHPLSLRQVAHVDLEESRVTLKAAVVETPDESPGDDRISGGHVFLRRWDQRSRESDGLLSAPIGGSGGAKESEWVTLEDGIQVRFSRPQDSSFRVSDYWHVPARVASADVEWPKDGQGKAIALPPHGVRHYYAPLAVVGLGAQNSLTLKSLQRLPGSGP